MLVIVRYYPIKANKYHSIIFENTSMLIWMNPYFYAEKSYSLITPRYFL